MVTRASCGKWPIDFKQSFEGMAYDQKRVYPPVLKRGNGKSTIPRPMAFGFTRWLWSHYAIGSGGLSPWYPYDIQSWHPPINLQQHVENPPWIWIFSWSFPMNYPQFFLCLTQGISKSITINQSLYYSLSTTIEKWISH